MNKTYTVQVSFEVEAADDKAAWAEAVRVLQQETPTDHMEVGEEGACSVCHGENIEGCSYCDIEGG